MPVKKRLLSVLIPSLLVTLAACDSIQTPAMTPVSSTELSFESFDGKPLNARFEIRQTDPQTGLRIYQQSAFTDSGDVSARTYQEDAERPYIRSGNTAFDALFAMAGFEMQQLSVSEIRDGAYNDGEAIPCECFFTGEKWHYVWTRDLSYAAYLKLAMLDPVRVENSLLFKLSGYRDGVEKPDFAAGSADGLQIIQDTGSGGSWHVSTDRITWSFGAAAALNSLTGDAREHFAKTVYKALRNTVENDRLVAFDASTGLYNGEQSFLDWREQTYAAWLPEDLSSMATSKALSTNAGFYHTLVLTAELANEAGDVSLAQRYSGWADALKYAINTRLWLSDAGLYSSLTAGYFDGAPMHKFDWLGQALAIITGIADSDRARSILANYPHGPMGAPVIYPQQAGIPVYHNRAIWPFVTAFGLKAAIKGNNQAVADAGYTTLIRGAALDLSNMENREWLSGQAHWQEPGKPDLSGPVINSKRQLWSVGAYLDMVIGDVFGINAHGNDLAITPYITQQLLSQFFAQSDVIELHNLTWKGKALDVSLVLPAKRDMPGVLAIDKIALNGVSLPNTTISENMLTNGANAVLVTLAPAQPAADVITRVSAMPSDNTPAVSAPYEANIAVSKNSQGNVVTISDSHNRGVVYNLYRNGEVVVSNLNTTYWVDVKAPEAQACYAVEVVYPASGNRSHHSQPVCVNQGMVFAVTDPVWTFNKAVKDGKYGNYLPDVSPQDDVSVSVSVAQSGRVALQLKYRNLQHAINTGITGGMRWYQLADATGNVVAQGTIALPHTQSEHGPGYSTPIETNLNAGVYSLTLHDFYNMSYLQNNRTYSAAGGESGPVNQFDLYGLRVMPMQ